MPLTEAVIDRLLLSKELLSPLRFPPAAQIDRFTLAKHILSSHDAAELALAGITEHLERLPTKSQVFLMDFFPALKEEHPEREVEGKGYFNQLNRVRVNVKHHGIFPDPQQWYRVGERTYEYVSAWCQQYLNFSLDDLDESYLISIIGVKERFEAARKAFISGAYSQTLEHLAFAELSLFQSSVALRGLVDGQPRAEDAIKLAAYGVNANDYLTLQEFLPDIKTISKGKDIANWEQQEFGHPANWRKDAAEFCLKTFLSLTLRIQNAT